MRLVVDASVAIKWVVAETDSYLAAPLLRHEVEAPDFILLETADILWKLCRRSHLTSDAAISAQASLLRTGLSLWPGEPLMPETLRIGLALDHAVYDCLYLALASDLGCPLITADRRFAGKCRTGGMGGRIIVLGETA